MVRNRKRIVLYFPQPWPRRSGPPYSRFTQELPLSLLSIAGLPLRDGYEVVLIDGSRTRADAAHDRVLDACEGALLYATTGILGPQVSDALRCTTKVKARFPGLPAFVGGWFASAAPHLQLETGLYDAVALGQGEITFREIVAAVDSGESLESVAGLALARDGEVVRTEARRVVGWDELPNCPWELLDPEEYRGPQRLESDRGTIGRVYGPGRPGFEITYYASFGCPMGCTYCCSPEFTGRRWEAMPADRMLDDLEELQGRWKFDGIFFYDANFTVSEKRVRELAEGMLARDLRFHYFAYTQADSVVRADPTTLDLMARSGLYGLLLGAEAGTPETLALIRKNTSPEGNLRAVQRLRERNLYALATYIIGFPDENEASMWATLEEARRVVVSCPNAHVEVYPYLPIPGAADWQRSLELGHEPPRDLEGWGMVGDYARENTWPGHVPPALDRARVLFNHYAALSEGRVRQRCGWWERRARRHLAGGTWRRARMEAKAFDFYQRLTRAVQRR